MRAQSSILLMMLLTSATASADDWPQWRGPGRDNRFHESGLLKAFPADGLKATWRRPVSWGYSSPIVSEGRVFLTDAKMSKPIASERVLCFDETAGTPLWTYEYESPVPDWAYDHEHSNGPCPTPIAAAGKVYTVGGSGHVHCLDALNGKPIWERDLFKQYKIAELSCRPSPLLDGNLLVVFTGAQPGASVIVLDKDTGAEVWKALEDKVSNSSPVIITAGSARQLIVWSDDAVTSLDPATGKVHWREALTTSNNDSIPTPVALNARLLVGGLMFALDPAQPAATILWPHTDIAVKRILCNTSTAMLEDDFVYTAKSGGGFVCLDAATGTERWNNDTVTERKGGASVHITPTEEGFAYLYTDRGDLVAAKLAPDSYQELARAHLITPTTPFAGKNFAWSPPAFANHHIFVRNDEELLCASLQLEP